MRTLTEDEYWALPLPGREAYIEELEGSATYDPVTRRYRAVCPLCGFVAVRSKAETAGWVLAQHLAYEHERPRQ